MIKNIVPILILILILILFITKNKEELEPQAKPNTDNIDENNFTYKSATDMEVGLDYFSCMCEAEYEYEFADQEEDVWGNEFGYGCEYKDECCYEQSKKECICNCYEIDMRKIEEENEKLGMKMIIQDALIFH